ncbi:MAG: glycosyltransferase [Pseudomonadota bacterium]
MHLVDTTLFFSPTSGGVRRYLTAKHAWLGNREQWTHSLLVPGDDTRLERGGVSTIAGTRVPGTFNYRLPLTPRLWSDMLEQLEPDLIESGDAFHPAWCAVGVARRRHIPCVAFFHSHLPRLVGMRCGSIIGNGAAQYLRWIYERFDLVMAPSRAMCDYLRSLGLSRVALQPLGVDASVFHPGRRNENLRGELGLAADTRLLVYAGRFSEEKNIPLLHQAMARLGSRYHLLLVGGGENRRPAANITMRPYKRDSHELATVLASADALIHAGTAETFGLVVLEAMACGRPVVGIRAGAVPELVDETVGVIAARADGRLLANAVVDLYDRDIQLLGAAARARVLARFTWEKALQLQLAAYAALSENTRTLPEGWATARRLPSGDQQAMPAGPSSN